MNVITAIKSAFKSDSLAVLSDIEASNKRIEEMLDRWDEIKADLEAQTRHTKECLAMYEKH